MEISTTAAVSYGPVISLRGPRDNLTPEKPFTSLVQVQPDQTWVEGEGMFSLPHSLPHPSNIFPSTSISIKQPDLEDTGIYSLSWMNTDSAKPPGSYGSNQWERHHGVQ